MTSPSSSPPPRYGASLERRLPLLIVTLLVAVVVVFGVVAYGEVRSAAVERAMGRIGSFNREIARSSALSTGRTLAALRARAQHPAVVLALAGGDTAAAAAALAGTRTDADSTIDAWELVGADGRRRFRAGVPATAEDGAQLARAVGDWSARETERRSPLYPRGGTQTAMITVVPVLTGGRVAGFLAEQRHMSNSRRADSTIRALVGEDVTVYATSRDQTHWATTYGRPVPAPFSALPAITDDTTVLALTGADGERYLLARAVVQGTPWVFAMAERESEVLARPREFLRRMSLVALLVLAAGALAAWLVSRHVTRPLRTVTTAAEQLAQGDYTQRVAVRGHYEIARLADTFNAMAGALGDAHATLAERNEALERANHAKASFLAMMSHELRTPLNAIAGYTELLQLGVRGPVTDAQVEDLGRIRHNKDHLLTIINDILSFARLDAGQLELRVSEFPVQSALRDVEEMLRQQFTEKGVGFRVECPDAELRVRADREKLRQILTNLVTNALRFTDPGGTVTMRAVAVGGQVQVAVEDTGVGIPATRLDTIFEPFMQVDSSLTRRVGGTGLGLAIARELAQAMGGTIAVESREGVGSLFTVRLPAPIAVPQLQHTSAFLRRV